MNLHDYDWNRLVALGYPTDFAEKMKDDPCWKGYEMVGMKKKGSRQVPNCVPLDTKHGEAESESLSNGRIIPTKTRRPFIFGPSAGSPSM